MFYSRINISCHFKKAQKKIKEKERKGEKAGLRLYDKETSPADTKRFPQAVIAMFAGFVAP